MEQQPAFDFDAPPPAPPATPPPPPAEAPTPATAVPEESAPVAVRRVVPRAWAEASDPPAEAAAVRRLALAVVWQAVKDVTLLQVRERDRAEARRFLFDEAGAGDLGFWCGVLDADPRRVRQAAAGLLAGAAAESAGRASRPTAAA